MRVTELRQAKIDRIRRRESLHDLVGHAERIELVNGRARVTDKMPAPVDEHGIPRVDRMVDNLLGQMATKAYVWTGKFDLHHMATPRADYNVVPDNVGVAFRSLPILKLELPRQMHNLSHELFHISHRPPSTNVMRQAVLESEQLRTLFAIMSEELDEDTMQVHIHDTLDNMIDPRVDIMPPREDLAAMELHDLRCAVASLTRIRRYANKRLIHPDIRPRAALRHKIA